MLNVEAQLPIKADLRRDITAWKALVWAYRSECVRAVGEEELAEVGAITRSSILMHSSSGRHRGTINGRLDCHIDAIAIHSHLLMLLDAETALQVMKAAEAGEPPAWHLTLPRKRLVPGLNRKTPYGVIHHLIDGRTRRASYCPLREVGLDEEERVRLQQAQMTVWLDFVHLLRRMCNVLTSLEKWRMVGLGVEPEPWVS